MPPESQPFPAWAIINTRGSMCIASAFSCRGRPLLDGTPNMASPGNTSALQASPGMQNQTQQSARRTSSRSVREETKRQVWPRGVCTVLQKCDLVRNYSINSYCWARAHGLLIPIFRKTLKCIKIEPLLQRCEFSTACLQGNNGMLKTAAEQNAAKTEGLS